MFIVQIFLKTQATSLVLHYRTLAAAAAETTHIMQQDWSETVTATDHFGGVVTFARSDLASVSLTDVVQSLVAQAELVALQAASGRA